MVRGETDKSTGLVVVSSQDTGKRGLHILQAPKMKPSGTEGKAGCPCSQPAGSQNHIIQPEGRSEVTTFSAPQSQRAVWATRNSRVSTMEC